jgi:hypothetical protein
MRKLFTLIILFFAASTFAQTAYNSPESIEFDYTNNRWLISNRAAGTILARSSATGLVTLFTAAPTAPYGIEIVGNTAYVCDNPRIKGYDLTTGTEVFNVNITGASFLNGLTHDNSGNLYATDFSAKKIYRVKIATQTFTTLVTGLAKSPNGIVFDQPNNRCVFVNWGTSAPIMAVNLADSTTSTLLATSLSNCDGITKDAAGNYFVSSWGLQGVSEFNSTFTSGPTTVVTGLSNPADIFYNTVTDTLGVPNAGNGNNTTYHYLGTPDCAHNPTVTPDNLILCPNTTDTLWTQQYDSYKWYKDGNLIPNATNQYYVVSAFNDGGSMFKVEATLNNCTEISPEVLVDGWAFLPVTVITEGLQDTLCAGEDTLFLIMGMPYDTDIQWTKGGIDLPGENNDTLVVTTSGVYSVSGAPSTCPDYNQSLGLQLTYTFVNCSVGLDENILSNISIYPNPATNFITITKGGQQLTYTLNNMLGQVLRSGNITTDNYALDIASMPTGVYVLNLKNANGLQVSKRIIKAE